MIEKVKDYLLYKNKNAHLVSIALPRLIIASKHVEPRQPDGIEFFRSNYDYGNGIGAAIERYQRGEISSLREHLDDIKKKYRSKKKKNKKKASRYCAKEDFKKYYKEFKAKDDDDSFLKALEDFMKYIDEVLC